MALKTMTDGEAREFADEIDGFNGEVTFYRVYPNNDGSDERGIYITGFPMYDQDFFNEKYGETCGCPEGREKNCPHDMLQGLDDTTEMLVVELFAEGLWGRSHRGVGQVHRVKYTECRRTKLVDPETIKDEALREQVYETQI